MIEGQKKFNKEEVDKMCQLRKDGWSFSVIAKRFKCDRTSIMYHTQKEKITPQVDELIKISYLQKDRTKLKDVEKNFKGEKINKGKTYAEYREIEREKLSTLNKLKHKK